ncbi:MAG: relaxase/mobilization nuclease domain-containing protein [Ruminococcus sp.]|nr:relaxase/mobilization nuclease domain-containing protein [Ruminococcus sp.]
MATTKLHGIRSTLNKSIEYIIDPWKTRNGSLVISNGCSTSGQTAQTEFENVRKQGSGRSKILAQHIIQSFAPGEITPEEAQVVGLEFCQKLLGENYQYILATHVDHEHIHNHIIVNNTNSNTHNTFETEFNQGKKSERAWAKVRELSDEICKKYCLSVIQNPENNRGKTHYEWDMSRQGLSWKAKLKLAIDNAIKESDDFAVFLLKCAQNGILVYYNPEHTIDLKFMLAEQKERNPRAKFTRAKTLGWFYETEQIKSRIVHYKKAMEYKPKARIVRVPVQVEDNKFIRDSIDRSNMKLTSKAMNILTKYGVTAEEAKAESIAAFSERVALVQELNAISDEIKELEERPETLRKFWAFKPYYDEYKSLSGRKQEKYKKAHGGTLSDYHELKKKLLEWYPSGHVPTAEKLNKHIAELRKQSAQKNARYRAIKLKADELSQAANEIEQYLRQEQSRDQQKKRRQNVLE